MFEGVLSTVVAITLAGSPGADWMDPVDPAVYRSRSEQLELFVDPVDRWGSRGARYLLERNGERVWSGELPFTLTACLVAEDGQVVGQGTGWWEGSSHRWFAVLLGADGSLRDSFVRRQYFPFPHGGCFPRAFGPVDLGPEGSLFLRLNDKLKGRPETSWLEVDLVRGQISARWSLAEELKEEAAVIEGWGEGSGPSGQIVWPSAEASSLPDIEMTLVGRWPLRIAESMDPDGWRILSGVHEGRIFINDPLNALVHVFEGQGRNHASLEAPRGFIEHVVPTADWPPRLEPSTWRNCCFADRATLRGTSGHRIASLVASTSGTLGGWGWHHIPEVLVRLDASGVVDRIVERRPGDRRWLRTDLAPAVAPDGSVAVWSEGLALFSSEGEPLRSLRLPGVTAVRFLGYVGERLLVETADAAFLFDPSDDSLRLLRAGDAERRRAWQARPGPHGREIWWIHVGSMELERYAVPN